MVKTLEKAGDQFDAAYAKAQLDAHEAAVELFENYASKGENKELQKFAVQSLPTLHGHLEKIKEIGSPHCRDEVARRNCQADRNQNRLLRVLRDMREAMLPLEPGARPCASSQLLFC